MTSSSVFIRLDALRQQVETSLMAYLDASPAWLSPPPATTQPAVNRFEEALRYAVLGGGKRLRPILLLLVGQWLGASLECLMPTACALELIHTYSLIHDDLPCMDNADLRRGRPTVHCAYDETTAVLVGDALQPLAVDWMLTHTPTTTLSDKEGLLLALKEMTRASGLAGLVMGQAVDCHVTQTLSTEADLLWLHTHKTGALFGAALACGACLSGAEPFVAELLRNVGHQWGIAFQLADDVLDATATPEALGKTTGQDATHGKGTLLAQGQSIHTIQAQAERWLQKGLDSLAHIHSPSQHDVLAYDTLCDVAWALVRRHS